MSTFRRWRRQREQHTQPISPTTESLSHTPNIRIFYEYLPSSSHRRVQCTHAAGQQPPHLCCCCCCFWDSMVWKVLRLRWRQVVNLSRCENLHTLLNELYLVCLVDGVPGLLTGVCGSRVCRIHGKMAEHCFVSSPHCITMQHSLCRIFVTTERACTSTTYGPCISLYGRRVSTNTTVLLAGCAACRRVDVAIFAVYRKTINTLSSCFEMANDVSAFRCCHWSVPASAFFRGSPPILLSGPHGLLWHTRYRQYRTPNQKQVNKRSHGLEI